MSISLCWFQRFSQLAHDAVPDGGPAVISTRGGSLGDDLGGHCRWCWLGGGSRGRPAMAAAPVAVRDECEGLALHELEHVEEPVVAARRQALLQA